MLVLSVSSWLGTLAFSACASDHTTGSSSVLPAGPGFMQTLNSGLAPLTSSYLSYQTVTPERPGLHLFVLTTPKCPVPDWALDKAGSHETSAEGIRDPYHQSGVLLQEHSQGTGIPFPSPTWAQGNNRCNPPMCFNISQLSALTFLNISQYPSCFIRAGEALWMAKQKGGESGNHFRLVYTCMLISICNLFSQSVKPRKETSEGSHPPHTRASDTAFWKGLRQGWSRWYTSKSGKWKSTKIGES